VLLMICCFCLLSVGTRKIKRWLLGLNIEMHWELLRNRVGGDVGDQGWTLDWDTMEFAQPLHGRSLHSLSYYHSSQHLVSWPLFSHLLEEYNLLCLHSSPLMQN
jgi:hypothetical protein